jgi:hypothetical protein
MAIHMNKYIFVYCGYDTSSTDLEQAWHDGFALRADHFIDPGNPFGPNRKVPPSDARDPTADDSPAAGYSIVRAASLSDAERILEGCPIVDSCHIYETIAV